MIDKLLQLKNGRSSFTSSVELERAIQTDPQLRVDIQLLTQKFLNRTLGGCSNCYFDAYLELIHLNINQVMEKENCKFQIRRGVVLRDVVNYDFSLNMTQNNISDELALYHLATNPDCIQYFDKTPDNLDQLIEEYKSSKKNHAPKGEQAADTPIVSEKTVKKNSKVK